MRRRSKSKIKIQVKKGLMDPSYKVKHSRESRKRSINKTLKKHSKLEVMRHLNVIRTYNKNKSAREDIYNRLDNDVKYVQSLIHKDKKTSKR